MATVTVCVPGVAKHEQGGFDHSVCEEKLMCGLLRYSNSLNCSEAGKQSWTGNFCTQIIAFGA